MTDLFDLIHAEDRAVRYGEWEPEAPPSLTGVHEVYLDFETTGLKWWEQHRPVGVAYYLPDGRTGYLPWGHHGGGNLDEAIVKEWFKREVRSKHIINLNTKFECHMARSWGIDFEEQGNTVADVAHYAALLDDHRRTFSLQALCDEFLPDEQKVTRINGEELDGSRMAEYPAGMIAVRAMADVRQVFKLSALFLPQLREQGLMRVVELENNCIYATAEMERNAALIDMGLLKQWVKKSEQEYLRICYHIRQESGIDFNPDKNTAWTALFKKLGIPIQEFTETTRDLDENERRGSFTDAIIKDIEHPVVKLARRAGKLSSLRSKYLGKYYATIGPDSLLRFALHQLRSDEGGTISGRFSSSAIKIGKEKIGANIQQVMATEKQRVTWGYDEDDASHDDEIFLIRKLFIPSTGLMLAADAKQIEYRIFADYTRSPKLLRAYRENPDLRFHHHIWEMLKPYKPDLTYKQQKNMNFMRVYGGGIVKLALMLGHITASQADALNQEYPNRPVPREHYLLKQTLEIDRIYAQEMPEVRPLLEKASQLARERGYVKTILGRRMRFPDRQRLHKAFNGVVQGSAADVLKQKMVELHRTRKETGFVPRMTVHDELVGDVPSKESAQLITNILNSQSFPEFEIPILWDTKIGHNWADCKPMPLEEHPFPKGVADATRGGRSR